jgi:hypothetical protein
VAPLPAQENQACSFVPSVTSGAAGAVGPFYTGMPVSLAFQDKGSRSCSGGSVELCVTVCTRKQDLLLSNVIWSCVETSGAGDMEC